MLYASEQRRGCFAEVLASYRPDLALLARLKDLPDGDEGDEIPQAGGLPVDWRAKRFIATFACPEDQGLLDLRDRTLREQLRREMAPVFLRLGLTDFDLSDALSRDRRVTQAIARWAHESGYQLITYISRHGNDLDCWALLEGAQFTPLHIAPIANDDSDLLAIAGEFGLRVGPERIELT